MDANHRAELDAAAAAITAKSGKACTYHPQGSTAGPGGTVVGGSFIDGALFAIEPLGEAKPLTLSRKEISEIHSHDVQRKIADFVGASGSK